MAEEGQGEKSLEVSPVNETGGDGDEAPKNQSPSRSLGLHSQHGDHRRRSPGRSSPSGERRLRRLATTDDGHTARSNPFHRVTSGARKRSKSPLPALGRSITTAGHGDVKSTAMMMQERAAQDAKIRRAASASQRAKTDPARYVCAAGAGSARGATDTTITNSPSLTASKSDTILKIDGSLEDSLASDARASFAPNASFSTTFKGDFVPGSIAKSSLQLERHPSVTVESLTSKPFAYSVRRTDSDASSLAAQNLDISGNTLGSTFFADRDKKFRQSVDQSVNLMSVHQAASGYGQGPETERRRIGKDRHGGQARPQRGSVMEIIFGSSSSQRTVVRKKSMIDILLGPDPSQLKGLDSEREQQSTLVKIKYFLANRGPFIVIFLLILVMILLTVKILHERLPSYTSPTPPVIASTTSPQPTPYPGTVKPTKAEPAPVRASAQPAKKGITPTPGSVPASDVALISVLDKGVPHVSNTKAANDQPEVIQSKGLSISKEASAHGLKNATAAPKVHTDPKSQLVTLIQKHALTDPKDLDAPNSSASRALQWLLQLNEPLLEAIDVEADKGKAQMDQQKMIEQYVMAVLYYSTTHEGGGGASNTNLVKKGKQTLAPSNYPVRQRRQLDKQDQATYSHHQKPFEEGSEWMEDGSICEWKGVRCSEEGVVTHLKLTQRGLSGTIPSELYGLKVRHSFVPVQ
jgi:hypothetical protein